MSTVRIHLRADIPATLRGMKPGTSAKFKAKLFAPYASVRSAISRLNRGHIDPIYQCSTDDNGETFTIVKK